MSRGQEQLVNPCNRWFSWAGSTGELYYYDKETKSKVKVETPFTFLLLDTLATVKGYDEGSGKGIYSNEVRNTQEQKLNVRCGNETIAMGLYKEIKDKIVSKGGGYASSCYIAYKDESGNLRIGNILMSGSSLSGGTHKPADKKLKDVEIDGWLTFSKNNKGDIFKKAVTMTKDERMCVKGATKYYAPKFKIVDITAETDNMAIALNKELQAYLSEYFKKDFSEVKSEATEPKKESVDTFAGYEQRRPTTPSEPTMFADEEDGDLPF
jgi:hypothetical protein